MLRVWLEVVGSIALIGMNSRWRWAWCVAALSSLSACTPNLNWREVRADGSAVHMLMPCKPDHLVRKILLAGVVVNWHQMSCEAGGAVWGMGYATLEQPDLRLAVLADLQARSLSNWQLTPATVFDGWSPSKQASWVDAKQLRAEGRLPDGGRLSVQAAWAAQDSSVFQWTVLGRVSDLDSEAWWSSVSIHP
jgi:hypothetical protein